MLLRSAPFRSAFRRAHRAAPSACRDQPAAQSRRPDMWLPCASSAPAESSSRNRVGRVVRCRRRHFAQFARLKKKRRNAIVIHRLGLACYRASVSVQRAAAALSRAWSKRTSSPGPAPDAPAAPDAPSEGAQKAGNPFWSRYASRNSGGSLLEFRRSRSGTATRGRPYRRRSVLARPIALPLFVPSRRAYSIPATTRSRMMFRSSSATASIIVNIALPIGVDVSRPSWEEMKLMQRGPGIRSTAGRVAR